jgi:hypothetical protein
MSFWGSRDSWQNIGAVPSVKLEGSEFKLTLGATLTDFVSFTPHLINCFLISEKAKLLIDQYNLKNVAFLKTTVLAASQEYNYYLLHTWPVESDLIDFSSTVLSEDGVLFEPKDHEEFKSIQAEYPFCGFKKTSLKDTFEKNIDLFRNIDGEIYISTRLRDGFKSSNISGINILVNKGELSKWPTISVQ